MVTGKRWWELANVSIGYRRHGTICWLYEQILVWNLKFFYVSFFLPFFLTSIISSSFPLSLFISFFFFYLVPLFIFIYWKGFCIFKTYCCTAHYVDWKPQKKHLLSKHAHRWVASYRTEILCFQKLTTTILWDLLLNS